MARPCRLGVNVRFEPSSPGLLIQFWLKLVKEVILLNNLEDQQGKVVGYIVVAVPVHIRYNGIQYLAGRSRSVFENRLQIGRASCRERGEITDGGITRWTQ